jgi:hypothetical protein
MRKSKNMSNLVPTIKKVLGYILSRVKNHQEHQHIKLLNFLLNKSGSMVYSGPFATMPIPSDLLSSHEKYYVLGSYERCLHQSIYELITTRPKYGIVVGAHKGYYSVGLLYTIRDCKITAFESSETLHLFIERWAKFSKVLDRLEIRSTANIETLQNLKEAPDFVIIDCEGAEDFILSPNDLPWLTTACVICELHDFYVHGLLGDLVSRFSPTHRIKIIDSYSVPHKEYPILARLSEPDALECVREDRWILSTKNKNSKIWTTGRFFCATPKNE